MTILRLANLLTCQILAQTRLQQRQVTVFGFFQQGVHRLRFVGFEAVNVQRRQFRVVVAGDLTQFFNRVVEIVTGGHFVRQHGIVLRTGVLYVSDGDQAHVETLGGLIQLTINRLFLRLRVRENVNGVQHFKIGARGVEDQRLLVRLEGHVLNTRRFFLQGQRTPFRHIEKGLR